jgi:hypothetical protein
MESDMKILCENLVFNKIPEATDDMLERTTYERACIEAKKKNTALPKKPRAKGMCKKQPRMKFPCDDFVERPAVEPPTPTSDAAVNHVPNPYLNSKLAHPAIAAIRAKASIQGQNLDHAQDAGLYSGEWSFVRSRDSVRTYITKLFNDRIAMYDGAMGTMIQNYGKKHKLEEEQCVRAKRVRRRLRSGGPN